ncbi:DUF1365 family protein [Streptomyces sp. NPDC059355]|uniref:DUF1365 family protein n=1 Tax=Streptomyces sp. NPDC059355 TaxID=3346811 RepID=UPI0036AD91D3
MRRTEGTGALYECVIGHARVAPLLHSFRRRTHLWCVDLDRMPVLPRPVRPLARFDAPDHFTGGAGSIRAALDAFLAARGVDLGGGRVVMPAHARVFGFVFNPLSVYGCHNACGAPVYVVAEVRPATVPAAARRPWPTVAVRAGIRRHGVRLLLRGLAVHPRPPSAPQEGMPS